ncbi:MAG: DUF1990 family protein [Gemmataceae bacterium]
MFQFQPPTELELAAVRLRQSREGLSYPHEGCTQHDIPPPGYDTNDTRITLGHGNEVFQAARAALLELAFFPRDWVQVDAPRGGLRPEGIILIVARVFHLVSTVNACRIVWSADEPTLCGFAYGTLPGHIERGEELFLLTIDPINGIVQFRILAYSQPRHILARLFYPFARFFQRKFARDAARAMTRAVAKGVRSQPAVPAAMAVMN